MIDVVTPDRYTEFGPQLKEMYELRHRVFVERLGWDLSGSKGAKSRDPSAITHEERDQFDRCDPTYLLWRDHRGRVSGSWRLMPTTGPYMAKDVFPELLDGLPPPASPDIWEGSRFAVEEDVLRNGQIGRRGLAAASQITSGVFCGVTEFCLAKGIREVLCVYETRIARILPLAGCLPDWQSHPHEISGMPVVLGRFAMTNVFLQKLRTKRRSQASVIRSAPWLDNSKVA